MRKQRRPKDITGMQVGSLTAVAPVRRMIVSKIQARNGNTIYLYVWLWSCTCGKTKLSPLNRLHAKSTCGRCQRKPGKKARDLTGKHFGSWIVLERTKPDSREIYWLCRCKCGNEKAVKAKHLKARKSLSCLSCANKDNSPGAKLRRQRLKAGLSLRQLAKIEGVSYQAISSREHAKHLSHFLTPSSTHQGQCNGLMVSTNSCNRFKSATEMVGNQRSNQ